MNFNGTGTGIGRVFEQLCKSKGDSDDARREGARIFVENFHAGLGLESGMDGRLHYNREKVKYSPDRFTFSQLAFELMGSDAPDIFSARGRQPNAVFEAGSVALTPGDHPNVSAFLGSVVGLLDAKVLAAYETPDFIIPKIIPTETTRTRQTKVIGMGAFGDELQDRAPGMPHAVAKFEERYLETPETNNQGLSVHVTFEDIFFERTGQVLTQANNLGHAFGLRKEYDGFKVLAGITNPYNYKDVAYNTYLTSGAWINDVTNNLYDYTDLNVVHALFSRMVDQENSQPVISGFDTLIVSPAKEETAKHILSASEIESRTQAGAEIRRGSYAAPTRNLLSSRYLNKLLTTSVALGGLALTQAQADEYWWALDTKGEGAAFRLYENWPFSKESASPDDFTAKDRRLVLSLFGDQMHAFMCMEPRKVIRNTNE